MQWHEDRRRHRRTRDALEVMALLAVFFGVILIIGLNGPAPR